MNTSDQTRTPGASVDVVHMDVLARKMARHWCKQPRELRLLGHRENTVYALESTSAQPVVLRLLRSGYNSLGQLHSEIQWLQHLHQQKLPVPQPLPSRQGKYLHRFSHNGRISYANATTFVYGDELKKTLANSHPGLQIRLWFELGALTARLHHLSDTMVCTDKFNRRQWDVNALLGQSPQWGKFWQSPLLNDEQQKMMHDLRRLTHRAMKDFVSTKPDYGLIHCDLNPNNVFCQRLGNDWALSIIDFDDGGFGYRVYDLIVAVFGYHDRAEFSSWCAALFDGYASVRPINIPTQAQIDLLMLVRALSLLGWLSERLDDCADERRPKRSVERALSLAQNFLHSH